jgi:hypothetical protein
MVGVLCRRRPLQVCSPTERALRTIAVVVDSPVRSEHRGLQELTVDARLAAIGADSWSATRLIPPVLNFDIGCSSGLGSCQLFTILKYVSSMSNSPWRDPRLTDASHPLAGVELALLSRCDLLFADRSREGGWAQSSRRGLPTRHFEPARATAASDQRRALPGGARSWRTMCAVTNLRVVSSRPHPTDEDERTAAKLLLGALAGDGLDEVPFELASLHQKYNTFPGDVFMVLAADALLEGGFNRDEPFSHEDVRDRYLPEYNFRGRDLQKLRYALLCAASTNGGVVPDLLDEVSSWGTDDFWLYSMFAVIAYVRAAAAHLDVSIGEICRRLADRRHLDL